ncbi:MAG: hypothetical protein KGP27_12050 [Hyphomicrobiales bacterium]|nr:hypothetical protein [Hyphomicrobiales bacterium]
MTRTDETPDPRDEIEMLLPWYVTGKLDADDRRRVDAALATDAALRARLDLLREERAEVIAANEAIRAPRPIDVGRIVDRTEVSASRRFSAGLAGAWQQVREFFDAPGSRPVRWASAIAAAIMLAQAVAIGGLLRERAETSYETASGSDPGSAAPASLAMVRFADDATAAAISATLGRLSMSIVDGPKPGNLYRVRLGAGVLSDKERSMAIDRLMAESRVVVFVSTAAPAR